MKKHLTHIVVCNAVIEHEFKSKTAAEQYLRTDGLVKDASIVFLMTTDSEGTKMCVESKYTKYSNS